MGRMLVRLVVLLSVATLGYLAVREAADRFATKDVHPPRVRIEVPNPDF